MPTHDIDTRGIGIGAAAIAAAVALSIAVAFLLLRLWDMPARTDRVRLPYRLTIPGPTLQSAPQPDLARERTQKQAILDGAGWLDAAHTTARIPIATAMALLAQQAASAPEAAR